MPFAVRLALKTDLAVLSSVELLAAQRFDSIALIAGLEKRTVPGHQLQDALAEETLWVAVADAHQIVGFLMAERLDDGLHIAEMSVLPSHGRQGIGAALLDAVKGRATRFGLSRVSLTTFASVPWNGPFYSKHGFREMSQSEIGPGLAVRMKQEQALGLEDRVAMCHSDASQETPSK
jgi:predicted N-acetyltransferase YhbS